MSTYSTYTAACERARYAEQHFNTSYEAYKTARNDAYDARDAGASEMHLKAAMVRATLARVAYDDAYDALLTARAAIFTAARNHTTTCHNAR